MTSFPKEFIDLSSIRDPSALQLVSRLVESQRLILEAQLTQTKQFQEAISERLQTLGGQQRG